MGQNGLLIYVNVLLTFIALRRDPSLDPNVIRVRFYSNFNSTNKTIDPWKIEQISTRAENLVLVISKLLPLSNYAKVYLPCKFSYREGGESLSR